MPNHFLPYILLFLGSLFSFQMFWNIYDFGETQATLIYFKNITSQIPTIPNDGISHSIKMRLIELTSSDPSEINREGEDPSAVFNFKFYQDYMRENFGKFSHANLFLGINQTLTLVGINSEWMPYQAQKRLPEEEVQHHFRMTDISMLCLKEEKLFGYNLTDESNHNREWKYNFHHRVAGVVEAQAAMRKKRIMALGLYNPMLPQRMIRYYKSLTCNYSEANNLNTVMKEYCAQIDNFRGCHHANISYRNPNEYVDISKYEDIPIPLSVNDVIVNMAVENDLVVFTTLNSMRHIHFVFKREDGSWIYKKVKYDDDESDVRKLQVYQNLGLQFVFPKAEEKILLIIDIEGGDETGFSLVYTVYKFTTGKQMLDKNTTDFYKVYNFVSKNITVSQSNQTEEVVDESSDSDLQDADLIDPQDVYASSQYLLTQTKIKSEIFEYDPFLKKNFKNSIVYFHPETNQVLCISLEKYVLLLTMDRNNELFGAYQLDFFEDSFYKIKSVDINFNGYFFAFLTYYKESYRVYILYSMYVESYSDTELFKLEFDHSMDPERADLKDVKFIKNNAGELALMVMFTSGELATYSLDFMPSAMGDIMDIFFDDEISMISFFLVFSMITMFLANRLRPRILRANMRPPTM